MKILGIDYGTKRIGLAISDESQTIARELAIVGPKQAMEKIAICIAEHEVSTIVLGLPLNMSGQETQKTKEVKAFKAKLEKQFHLSVVAQDERLSSVMASSLPGGRKNVDSLAAQIILQNYLDRKSL